ncbi:hypothetical protein FM125_09735 [Micrococcus lylae]|uniref:Uncharacterized protein n=1 Tax=Micrococcus lylae TaxID=1273 RepID=A0A1R4JPB9_9MICC|nr:MULTISPECIES: putative transporter small subunit [Micrococcus]MCT2007855.1 putative transporter small subunit [Micrococcus lylae]MCT2071586.1 putative transporter small subunit [Micrococcus lylae]WIK81455.1 putative transporter small subunit [Micrococcus lylae]SJN33804.1 hypothetical protein FM125_09735 [Micrococcus lylae]
MTVALTVYVLMWPVIVFGVLAVIAGNFFKEMREARRQGRPMI